jgi:hypothetical protein
MILLSIVACLSTVGGVYGAVTWKTAAAANAGKDEQPKLQIMKTPMVSVPILSDGEVLGYVVTRLKFAADTKLLKTSSIQPEAFVADEAFRLIYETTPKDIKSGRKQALKELSAGIIAGTNKRLGRDVVKDVMVNSWTYLSKQDMMRNHER